jgi:hypothetical protein
MKGEHQYLPEHYLTLLERRPRAMANAAPLKYGSLPPELEKFRKLNRDKDKYEQLAKILLLGQKIDATALLAAVDWANRTGSPTYDAVRFYLETRNVEMNSQDKTDCACADPVSVDTPEFIGYDALFTKGDEHNE